MGAPLRIAFLVPSFPSCSETFVSRKVESLRQLGHVVDVFCVNFNHSVFQAKEWRRGTHVLPGFSNWIGCLSLLRVILGLRWLSPTILRCFLVDAGKDLCGGERVRGVLRSAAILSKRWDIIHVHFLSSLEIVPSLNVVAGCPVVASALGFDVTLVPRRKEQNDTAEIPDNGNKTRFAKAMNWVDGLIYSTEFLRGKVHELVGMSVPEIIIYPEVPTDEFCPKRRTGPHDPLRVVTVGRLDWCKGYVYSLGAIRELRSQGVRCEYRIVGEGNAREEIEFTIRQLGLSSCVSLLGARSPAEVAREMQWADVFLLTSVRESFGLVLAEAQASGLPVVASKVEGIPEAVREGETALLIPLRDHKAAADALYCLAKDEQLFARLSHNGPIWAQNFDMRRISIQLEEYYRDVIKISQTRLAAKAT